jgi:hypothetical protein
MNTSFKIIPPLHRWLKSWTQSRVTYSNICQFFWPFPYKKPLTTVTCTYPRPVRLKYLYQKYISTSTCRSLFISLQKPSKGQKLLFREQAHYVSMKITVRITDACPPPIAPKNSIYGSTKTCPERVHACSPPYSGRASDPELRRCNHRACLFSSLQKGVI